MGLEEVEKSIMKNQELVEAGMDIMESFNMAIVEAGGRIDMFQLKEMTAYEFISMLATNNVRFKYVEKKE